MKTLCVIIHCLKEKKKKAQKIIFIACDIMFLCIFIMKYFIKAHKNIKHKHNWSILPAVHTLLELKD